MKLYATVTSERASKGQGGNKQIVIDLNIEKETVGRVVMKHEEDNGYTIYYYPITETTGKGGRVLLHKEETKGKKQKGEHDGNHPNCEPCKKWLLDNIPF